MTTIVIDEKETNEEPIPDLEESSGVGAVEVVEVLQGERTNSLLENILAALEPDRDQEIVMLLRLIHAELQKREPEPESEPVVEPAAEIIVAPPNEESVPVEIVGAPEERRRRRF